MKPVEPIAPGYNLEATNIAEEQDEYETLPAHILPDGRIITRWRLTWRERLRVLLRGDIYHYQHAFRRRMQPIMMDTTGPVLLRHDSRVTFSAGAPLGYNEIVQEQEVAND